MSARRIFDDSEIKTQHFEKTNLTSLFIIFNITFYNFENS